MGLLYLFTILGEKYKSFSSLLCNLIHSPVTSPLLGPNTLLNTMFSNTLSFPSSRNVSDQASHPYTPHPHYIQSDVGCTRLLPASASINNPSEPLLTSVHTFHSIQLFTVLIDTDIDLSVGTGGQPAL